MVATGLYQQSIQKYYVMRLHENILFLLERKNKETTEEEKFGQSHWKRNKN